MTRHAPAESPRASERNPSSWFRAMALVGLALGAGVWLTGRLDQRAEQHYPGRLQARMMTVTAERAARLQEIPVLPGQRVKAGETLLVLANEQLDEPPHLRQQQNAQAEKEAIRIKAAADLELHWRRRELQAEIFQTQFKLAGLRQEKLHQEVEQLAWRENLLSDVFAEPQRTEPVFNFLSVSSSSAPEQRVRAMLREDAAVSAAHALASQISLCEQRLEDLRTLDRGLEEQIRLSHGVAAAEEHSRLTTEQNSPSEEPPATASVVSPGYGLIGLTKKQPGELVQPGEVLVQILDDDRRTIEVDIPSSTVVRFTPGQQVRLEFPGPQPRTGIVTSISPQTTERLPRSQDQETDAPVRLVIEPSGKTWPAVSIGSRVLVFEP